MKIMKEKYEIREEGISVNVNEYSSLSIFNGKDNMNVCYVGKHKAIQPNEEKEIKEADMNPELLIECRIFNEAEEYYIFPKCGKVQVRHIKPGDSEDKRNYISKTIQLRNQEGKGTSETKNDELIVHHYISEEGGYDFMRYVKIEKNG